MRQIFFGFFLFLGGCASPHLFEKEDGGIGIAYAKKSMTVAMEKTDADNVSLDGLLIRRTLYAADDSRALVYEDARTLPPYSFQYDVVQSLGIVFETSGVKQIARVGNLGFYALTFKDGGRPLYTMVENRNKKGLVMLYGLTRKQMAETMSAVGAKRSSAFETMGEGRLLPRTAAAFMSRWNPKMTILDGLLQRTGGSPYVTGGAF